MAYTTLGNVRHNGVRYKSGETIEGLKEVEANRLVALGLIEGEGEAEDVLTIEQFSKLSAADQKEQLDSRGIETAANAADRIQQYTEWHAGRVSGHGDSEL